MSSYIADVSGGGPNNGLARKDSDVFDANMNVNQMASWGASTVVLLLVGCDPQMSHFDDDIVPIEDAEESLDSIEDANQLSVDENSHERDDLDEIEDLEISEDEQSTAACKGGPTPRNASEVTFCNEENEQVIANVAFPEGTPPPDGWPAVVVLHGSGGAYKQLKKPDPSLGKCSDQLESQFARWKKDLTAEGYAVIIPDSWFSRGFCDYYKDTKNKPKGFGMRERLLARLYDTRAAAKWACDNPNIDCDRMAVLGFSNGGSGALISVHDDLSDAKDPRFNKHGTQEWFVGAIAYYPGCGLEGVLSHSLNPKDKSKFFSPQVPVIVHHGEKDYLLDPCVEVRDPQVEILAKANNFAEDWFDLTVYPKADHSFDNAKKGDAKADLAARDAAKADTFARLEEWLKTP